MRRTLRLSRRELLSGAALTLAFARATAAPDFRTFAPTPPMGWNSWDSFGPTLNEQEARANAAVLARELLPHGYNVFTVDIQWYEPGARSYQYRRGAELVMDEWGRLLPAPNRFPSATGGAGFKPLADYMHGLGLKFGLHMLRGVPRQAAQRDLPIHGSLVRAGAIADRVNVCPWNTDMYGIDMSKPGAQGYYNSVVELYAAWGVDFIKADDMSRPYWRNAPEIHALRQAIDRCGRPIVLSLSPGETPLAAASDVVTNANLWRISDDFWDTWPALLEQFGRLARWSRYRRPGNWPDADMLPLGTLELGRRTTRLTRAEQTTLMTLWSIAQSPLIMGGDLRKLDDFTRALLTNVEVLAVNQHGRDAREIARSASSAVWAAGGAREGETFVALFNLRAPTAAETAGPVSVSLADLAVHGAVHVRDLWRRSDDGVATASLTRSIDSHGASLLRLQAA